MTGRIFKRTLLIFISWVGSLLLLFAGILFLGISCIGSVADQTGSGWFAIIGIIFFLGAIFLRIFAKELGKRIEIWLD